LGSWSEQRYFKLAPMGNCCHCQYNFLKDDETCFICGRELSGFVPNEPTVAARWTSGATRWETTRGVPVRVAHTSSASNPAPLLSPRSPSALEGTRGGHSNCGFSQISGDGERARHHKNEQGGSENLRILRRKGEKGAIGWNGKVFCTLNNATRLGC